jgi:cytochrome c-type biogenesis protein CcmE
MSNAKSLVGIVAGVIALSTVAFVMLSNASPYVTVAEAKKTDADNLHIQGDLLKETVQVDINKQKVRFAMRDDNGDTVNVLFHGLPPANMGEATRVVAVGGMKGETFESHKILTKCPSKYESDPKALNKTKAELN